MSDTLKERLKGWSFTFWSAFNVLLCGFVNPSFLFTVYIISCLPFFWWIETITLDRLTSQLRTPNPNTAHFIALTVADYASKLVIFSVTVGVLVSTEGPEHLRKVANVLKQVISIIISFTFL